MEFSASLLQFSVSHDASAIIIICWFAAQETFIFSIKKQYLKKNMIVFCKIIWWIERLKEQHLFEIEIFLTNAFIWSKATVKAFLLNKIKILLTPNHCYFSFEILW